MTPSADVPEGKRLPRTALFQVTMTDEEAQVFWSYQTRLSEIKLLKLLEKELTVLMTTPLENVSFKTKLALASTHYTCDAVAEWSYRNFDPKELSYLLSRRRIKNEAIPQVVSNPNLTWKHIKHVLEVTQMDAVWKELLIENIILSPVLMTRDLAIEILQWREKYGLSIEVATLPARAFYGFDDSIPDSWVERAVIGGA